MQPSWELGQPEGLPHTLKDLSGMAEKEGVWQNDCLSHMT